MLLSSCKFSIAAVLELITAAIIYFFSKQLVSMES
jgi:hypothetical protein